MNKKLYVGGINYSTTEEGLKEIFAQVGTVESVMIIYDRETNRSRGFGFVEMSTVAEAQKAIDVLNGQELDGRRLTVNAARSRQR